VQFAHARHELLRLHCASVPPETRDKGCYFGYAGDFQCQLYGATLQRFDALRLVKHPLVWHVRELLVEFENDAVDRTVMHTESVMNVSLQVESWFDLECIAEHGRASNASYGKRS